MRPKSHFTAAFSFLVIICLVWHSFTSQTPDGDLDEDIPLNEWSTARAMQHVKQIGQEAHYTGSEANDRVRDYISDQLKSLGLNPRTQRGYALDPYGNMARPINIMARVKGTNSSGKALLLMSHYDSDPHSAIGASDAGSGVATVLEGARAFLARNQQPKNNIIILFTDAEELGLVGAQLCVDEHPWAQDVGMILNFEARGSGGPSYMLVETNGGNRKIIEAFDEAGVDYPVANSLAYSIYKMIPNDTDLTVFRRDGDINGLNFAFIGDHFDYHTVLDVPERLDTNTLAHQGAYLMPLLDYLCEADLSNGLQTAVGDDHVYFPLPILGLIHFPFSWLGILIIAAGLGLIALVIVGIKRRRINFKDLFLGFVPFLGGLVLSYLIINYGWKAVAGDYFYLNRIRVFPYTGYWWIAAAALLSIAISFFLYHKFYHRNRIASHSVAPLFFLWLVVFLIAFPVGNGGIIPNVFLPGAGFFVVPLITGLLMLWLNIKSLRPSFIVLMVLAFPSIYIFVPFIKGFPVALGMSILFVAGILSALVFGLLVPIIGHYRKKHLLARLASLFAVGFIVTAFAKAEFSTTQPRASSLVFFQDMDSNEAQWASYDRQLSPWVQQKMGSNAEDAGSLASNTIDSKYGTRFRFRTEAEPVNLDPIDFEISNDTTAAEIRTVSFEISSQATVNRYEIFADSAYRFNTATINGKKAVLDEESGEALTYRRGGRILSIFVSENEPVKITLTFEAKQKPELLIYAASYDLLNNKSLDVKPRPEAEMPRPFVLNDAIVRKKLIKL
jgi:hypothetical protein